MTSLHNGSRTLAFAYIGSSPKIQSVSGSEPASMSYDNVGNELIGTYSARNLLQSIGNGDPRGQPGTTLAYSYDGRGVRTFTSMSTPGIPPWGGGGFRQRSSP